MMGAMRLFRLSLSWLLAAIPLAALLYCIARYYVEVPFMDEWDRIPLIEKSFRGELSFQDLWAQHNEHRILFPKMIIVALARFTSWNLWYEVAGSVLLACGCFLLIYRLIADARSFLGEHIFPWLIPIVSALVFSLRQWENWMIGDALATFLGICGALAGIVALSVSNFRRRDFLLAVFWGVVAIYSFASGFIYWPVGFFLLSFRSFQSRREKAMALGLWCGIALIAMLAYLFGYVKPTQHPSLTYGLVHPAEFLFYVCTYLGAPLFLSPKGCLLSLMGYCGMMSYLFIHQGTKKETYLACVALGLFSVGNAVLTALGRVGLHPHQALAFRYVTLSYPFWISMILLVAGTVRAISQGSAGQGSRRFGRGMTCAGALVVGLIAFFAVRASVLSIPYVEGHHRLLTRARQELFVLKDEAVLKTIYPSPAIVQERTRILKQRGLCVFRLKGEYPA